MSRKSITQNRVQLEKGRILANLLKTIQDQAVELERLKRGEFTEAERQNLCHNCLVQDGYPSFVEGCANYQKELFGRSERAVLRYALLVLRNDLGCWCKTLTSTSQDREHEDRCKIVQAAFNPEVHKAEE